MWRKNAPHSSFREVNKEAKLRNRTRESCCFSSSFFPKVHRSRSPFLFNFSHSYVASYDLTSFHRIAPSLLLINISLLLTQTQSYDSPCYIEIPLNAMDRYERLSRFKKGRPGFNLLLCSFKPCSQSFTLSLIFFNFASTSACLLCLSLSTLLPLNTFALPAYGPTSFTCNLAAWIAASLSFSLTLWFGFVTLSPNTGGLTANAVFVFEL